MSTARFPFELPSAKNLSLAKTVETFVPTPMYWEVLGSDSHEVIFGTRGSGKTMLLRMMSADHLLEFARVDERARKALFEEKRLGVFLPLGLDWCVAYRPDVKGAEQLFVDGLNLAACDAFVGIVESLVRNRVLGSGSESAQVLCARLSELWFSDSARGGASFLSLRHALLREQAVLQDVWRIERYWNEQDAQPTRDYAFRSQALFFPLTLGVRVVNEIFGLSAEHRWLLCLDELEDLQPWQLRLLATLIRGSQRGIILKITTQPYTLDSVETDFGLDVSAVEFRDYQSKRLQYDPKDAAYRELVTAILRRRLGRPDANPVHVFGGSTFSERAAEVSDEFARLRKLYLTAPDSVSVRKKLPAVALRVLRRDAQGNRKSSAYSGWETLVRISDGNPGVFVRLLNELKVGTETTSVEGAFQHQTIADLATAWHEWSQALYHDAIVLHGLIRTIGEEFSERLHRKVEDVEVEEEVNRLAVDLGKLDSKAATAFRVGARHALLVAEAPQSSYRYPVGAGVWRLAYFLAPKFWLVPRRGKAVGFRERQFSLNLVGELAPGSIEIGGEESAHDLEEDFEEV